MTKDEAREILQKLSNGVLTFMEAEAIECAIQALGDGWVSVDDGLPECDGNYLVLLNGGNIIEQLTTSYFRAEYKSFDASFTTHWQPLPSPPKPKQP